MCIVLEFFFWYLQVTGGCKKILILHTLWSRLAPSKIIRSQLERIYNFKYIQKMRYPSAIVLNHFLLKSENVSAISPCHSSISKSSLIIEGSCNLESIIPTATILNILLRVWKYGGRE